MSFTWRGLELQLFDHPHNGTLGNERAVELAIAEHWCATRSGRGLELGNVLGHYGLGERAGRPPRVVADRYEKAPGVRNVDVFALMGSFDWIVSISTLEHVRWDEPGERNPQGARAAVEYLSGLIYGASGSMLFTVGLGQHEVFDHWLLEHLPARFMASTLVRLHSGWYETDRPVWLPYQEGAGANSVLVATL